MGKKGSIFVLDLSFIGWYLLGALCLGLGHLFVNPYYEATRAELYIFLRERAIQNGLIDPRELNLYTNPPIPPYGMPPQQKDTTYVMYQKTSQAGPNSPYGTVPPVYPGSSVPTQGPVQGYTPNGVFQGALRIRLTGRRPLMGGTLPHIREIWFPRRHRTACRLRNPRRPSRRFREAGVVRKYGCAGAAHDAYGCAGYSAKSSFSAVPIRRAVAGIPGGPAAGSGKQGVVRKYGRAGAAHDAYGCAGYSAKSGSSSATIRRAVAGIPGGPTAGSGKRGIVRNTGAPVNPAEHVNTQMDTQNVVDVSEGSERNQFRYIRTGEPLPSGDECAGVRAGGQK